MKNFVIGRNIFVQHFSNHHHLSTNMSVQTEMTCISQEKMEWTEG